MSRHKLTVVVPAYNEGAIVGKSLRELSSALQGTEFEIIVVDDGSFDDTRAQVESAAAEYPNIRAISYRPNRGKGFALRTGISKASGDLIAFLDADADLNPQQLPMLIERLDDACADVVIGSKLHPESKLEYPPLRRLVSRGYFLLVSFLFGLPVHDTQTGIKVFRRQVLDRVLPNMQIEGFAFDLELLIGAHLFGYRIIEAPVLLTFDRTDRRPLSVLRASLEVALDTLRVFYWTSFWHWLSPSWSTKLWIMILLLGLVGGSVGLGHLLNNFAVPSPFDRLVDLLLLRFLDRTARDWILLVSGFTLMATAAIQLNKQIVAAFVRRGHPDLMERKGK